MSRHVSAGFIVFRQSEQNPVEYLLLQTPLGKQHWTPPKGHLEARESSLQAAERETKEEAGLDKDDLEYIDEFEEKITYDAHGQPKDVFYYLARLRNFQQSIQLSDEHQNFAWCNFQDACDLLKHNETQSVLEKVDRFLRKK